MLYRTKFDGIIDNILSYAGYKTIDQKFSIWPAGLSASLIKQSKQLGIKPETAAFMGLAKYVKDASALSNEEKVSIIESAKTIAFVKTVGSGLDLGVDNTLEEILDNLQNK